MHTQAPNIDPEKLWEMEAGEFNKWRRKNDYPRLIEYFINNLDGFNEWKRKFRFRKDQLTKPCLADFIKEYPHPVSLFHYKKSKIYRIGETSRDTSTRIRGKLKPEMVSEKPFIPFLTWYKINKGEFKNFHHNNPFYPRFHSAFRVPTMSTTSIMENLQLLKMGGVEIANPRFTLVSSDVLNKQDHVRCLDFVDLDFIRFQNEYAFTQINIDFSSMRHFIIDENSSFCFLNFYKTDLSGLKIVNSRLSQSKFEDCYMSNGLIFNSDINSIEIKNSEFGCIFDKARFTDLKTDIPIENGFELFQRLRVSMKQSGDLGEAGKYYYLEKLAEKKALEQKVRSLFRQLKRDKSDRPTKIIEILRDSIKYVESTLQNLIWGYGEKPVRILIFSAITVISCALLYYISPIFKLTKKGLFEAISISMANFITIQYDNIQMLNGYKYLAIFEGGMGIFLLSTFIAALAARHKY